MKGKCEESPPGRLLQGIREFNNRNWYDCHETVEDLWIGSEGELRNFYQGIIQIAIALHHWRNGNFGGALSLLQGGASYLSRVPARCQWVDVAALIADAAMTREALEELGKEHMGNLKQELLPRIKIVSAACR